MRQTWTAGKKKGEKNNRAGGSTGCDFAAKNLGRCSSLQTSGSDPRKGRLKLSTRFCSRVSTQAGLRARLRCRQSELRWPAPRQARRARELCFLATGDLR